MKNLKILLLLPISLAVHNAYATDLVPNSYTTDVAENLCHSAPDKIQVLSCGPSMYGGISQLRSTACSGATGHKWQVGEWETTSNTCASTATQPTLESQKLGDSVGFAGAVPCFLLTTASCAAVAGRAGYGVPGGFTIGTLSYVYYTGQCSGPAKDDVKWSNGPSACSPPPPPPCPPLDLTCVESPPYQPPPLVPVPPIYVQPTLAPSCYPTCPTAAPTAAPPTVPKTPTGEPTPTQKWILIAGGSKSIGGTSFGSAKPDLDPYDTSNGIYDKYWYFTSEVYFMNVSEFVVPVIAYAHNVSFRLENYKINPMHLVDKFYHQVEGVYFPNIVSNETAYHFLHPELDQVSDSAFDGITPYFMGAGIHPIYAEKNETSYWRPRIVYVIQDFSFPSKVAESCFSPGSPGVILDGDLESSMGTIDGFSRFYDAQLSILKAGDKARNCNYDEKSGDTFLVSKTRDWWSK